MSPKNDLLAWWESAFTQCERDHILVKYQPMVIGIGNAQASTVDRIVGQDGTLRLSLAGLATWFMSPSEDLSLARRIIDKAVELGEGKTGEVLERHITYHRMILVYYRDRTRNPDALPLAIEACQRQIALGPEAAVAFRREYSYQALPEHTGFKQLAIIREKARDYAEAVRLSHEAIRQGWAGDWEKRITRCEKRV